MHTNTEIALQESNKHYRAIFDQVGVGLTRMALDGRFLRVNQKFCDIVGYLRDELRINGSGPFLRCKKNPALGRVFRLQ